MSGRLRQSTGTNQMIVRICTRENTPGQWNCVREIAFQFKSQFGDCREFDRTDELRREVLASASCLEFTMHCLISLSGVIRARLSARQRMTARLSRPFLSRLRKPSTFMVTSKPSAAKSRSAAGATRDAPPWRQWLVNDPLASMRQRTWPGRRAREARTEKAVAGEHQ